MTAGRISPSGAIASAAASRARPPAVTRSGYALVDSGRHVATFGLGVTLWLTAGLLAVPLFNAVGAWVGANATWEWLAFGILAAFVVFVTSATIVEAVHRRKRTGS